jgi:hypothetical protein
MSFKKKNRCPTIKKKGVRSRAYESLVDFQVYSKVNERCLICVSKGTTIRGKGEIWQLVSRACGRCSLINRIRLLILFIVSKCVFCHHFGNFSPAISRVIRRRTHVQRFECNKEVTVVCLVQGRGHRDIIGVHGFRLHELGIANDKITSIAVVVKPTSKVTKFRPIIRAAAWVAELETELSEVANSSIERVTDGMARFEGLVLATPARIF